MCVVAPNSVQQYRSCFSPVQNNKISNLLLNGLTDCLALQELRVSVRPSNVVWSYVSCNFIDALYSSKYIRTLDGKEKVFVVIVSWKEEQGTVYKTLMSMRQELLMFYFC